MKVDEFKLKLMKFGNNMIDSYFPGSSMMDKTANSMIKYILKNKINDIDPILNMFAKGDGDIDIDDFVDFMKTNMIGNGLKLNFHDYISESNILKGIIPNRTLLITKDDLDAFIKQ